MKIAAGLISMFLGLLVLVQSCAVAATARLGTNTQIADEASVGIMVGFLIFVAGAFAFGLPTVSTVILVLAGLLGLGSSSAYADMGIWAVVALMLAALSGLAARSQRRARAAAQATSAPALVPTPSLAAGRGTNMGTGTDPEAVRKSAAPSNRVEPTFGTDRDGGAA